MSELSDFQDGFLAGLRYLHQELVNASYRNPYLERQIDAIAQDIKAIEEHTFDWEYAL